MSAVGSPSIDSPDERVLVLTPVAQDASLTAATLAEAGIEANIARGVFELCHRIEKGCGALLIAEEAVGESSLDVLVQLLARQPPWSDIPMIVITGGGELSSTSTRVYRAFGPHGNITLLERPFRKVTLISTVQSALRSRRRQYQTRRLIADLSAAEEQLRLHAKALEEHVAERTAELEETTQQLNAFCYTVAHDLRAPLRSQRSFANIIAAEFSEALGPRGCQYLAKISTAAERLDKLVADLLTHAKLSRQEIALKPVSLASVIKEALEDLADTITQTDAGITIRDVDFIVQADETWLIHVISNLVSNALKYVTPGTRPTVLLRAALRDDFVRLWVEDNGIGIAPEFHHKIFGVFERLHRGETYKGTGIGLAIVRTGINRMGGSCGVESDAGAGSRFWIELPASLQS